MAHQLGPEVASLPPCLQGDGVRQPEEGAGLIPLQRGSLSGQASFRGKAGGHL